MSFTSSILRSIDFRFVKNMGSQVNIRVDEYSKKSLMRARMSVS